MHTSERWSHPHIYNYDVLCSGMYKPALTAFTIKLRSLSGYLHNEIKKSKNLPEHIVLLIPWQLFIMDVMYDSDSATPPIPPTPFLLHTPCDINATLISTYPTVIFERAKLIKLQHWPSIEKIISSEGKANYISAHKVALQTVMTTLWQCLTQQQYAFKLPLPSIAMLLHCCTYYAKSEKNQWKKKNLKMQENACPFFSISCDLAGSSWLLKVHFLNVLPSLAKLLHASFLGTVFAFFKSRSVYFVYTEICW